MSETDLTLLFNSFNLNSEYEYVELRSFPSEPGDYYSTTPNEEGLQFIRIFEMPLNNPTVVTLAEAKFGKGFKEGDVLKLLMVISPFGDRIGPMLYEDIELAFEAAALSTEAGDPRTRQALESIHELTKLEYYAIPKFKKRLLQ
jgi:hypothetical protein